jgi:hypothetical protein
MKPETKPKDCFGDQGGVVLGGEPPYDCINCELIDQCHKVTIAVSLQSIAHDLDLIVQNGLRLGWLKSYNELERFDPSLNNLREENVSD